MTAVLIVAAWTSFVVLALAHRLLADRILRLRRRMVVVVTTRQGSTFRGVLFDVDPRSVVLRNAEVLESGSRGSVAVDGEVLILRSEISFLQRP